MIFPHRVLTAAVACSLLLIAAQPAPAQTFRGVGSCSGSECHTRKGEIDWLTTQPGGKEHRQSLARLKGSLDVSEKYAKAVGLDNVFAPKGMCLKCHGAYVESAKVTEGVGCEGCHGPAGGYRDFHQQNPKDYAGAVSRGLRNLKGNPTTWTRLCTGCHVLGDKPEYDALIEAGHKDGNRWRPQNKYTGVQAHWKRVSYTVETIVAAAAGKPVNVAVAPSTPAPAPTVTPDPVAPPSVPASPPSGTAKPGATTTPAPLVPPAGAGRVNAPGFSPSLPVTRPLDPPPNPAVVDPARGVVATSPLALSPPAPATASDLLGALQHRVAGFFTRLLGSGFTPDAPLKPLPASGQIAGPDAELLRIQAEALALAIEALNLKVKPPKPPTDK